MSNSNCKKSSSLNKKVCHRKKPKGSFNHTWSASTYKNQIQHECSTFNLTSASSYIVSTLPIETRIDFYEKKYQAVMEAETKLSSWIKSSRDKDPPPSTPILSKPISTATKSRLPDFIFSSLSTRSKRKNQLHFDLQPTAKSSISTFLKKASGTLTTSYNKQPSKRPQKSLFDNPKTPSTLQYQNNHRFSLTSSINRLSLSKNNYSNNMILSEDPSCSINNENKPVITTTTKSKYKRFSTTFSPHQENSPPPVQQKKTLKSSTDSTVIKKRPQSSLLPQSSSSIFLERLRSRSPISDNTPKSSAQTIQPNVLCQSNIYYNSNSSIGTMDDDTPPSSPSSIDSVLTPPLSHNKNSHNLYYQQRNKRRSQELFFNHAKPKTSISMMANITENKLLEQQEEKITLSQTNNNNCIPAATAPSDGGNYFVTNTTTATNHQAKKKRASLLITPSLSTIRLLSQKSQLLKRQSMLA
ncbi:hypothetical protein INT46_001632 [Mucor plumbeus]|uniref:Uncharacterized protein n=1 Tax=Mucor plumbeus TaxID=97098 RepID=A0A8H7V5Z7_9FUNG|nr:hypothetical protein INT46_001632 [Mucor plumbeus]